MSKLRTGRQLVDEAIDEQLIATLEHMTSDWDLELSGGIHLETWLGADLGCESLDIIRLIFSLQEALGLRELPLERLLVTDGHYVDDLRVRDVAMFLRAAVVSDLDLSSSHD